MQDEVLQRYLDFHEHMSRRGACRDAPMRQCAPLKAAIRRAEARAAARVCGVDPDALHFLDLPFYEKAREGLSAGQRRGHRHHGDGCCSKSSRTRFTPRATWPTRTARTGSAWKSSRRRCGRCSGEPWFADCEAWLYRGAWAAWPIHEVDMAVPLSPAEVACKQPRDLPARKPASAKRRCSSTGPGEPPADAARATSRLFDALGLPDYEAIETFHRWALPPS